MKLIRFVHERCDEYDSTEYLLAPEDLSWEDICEIVTTVKSEMVVDAKTVKDAPLSPPHWPPYDEHPDKTVAEVKALHAEQQAAYADWKNENAHLTRTFSERLRERGFKVLGDDDEGTLEVSVYWGHHHGLDLQYGPPKV